MDVTNLVTAVLFLVVAFICLRWYGTMSQENKEKSSQQLAHANASTEGIIIGVERLNAASMIEDSTNLLHVEYEAKGETRRSTVKVTRTVYNRYLGILRKLNRQHRKSETGLPPKEALPTIELHYRKMDPDTVWCDDSVKNERKQNKMFLVLAVISLVAAAIFGYGAIAG
ncbi:MAG TPA: hypothetical protein IAC12_05150 [Candidatus Aphodovivens avistercoris]|nr:hypothetical protein [Candidatus Aphodovivens avistercoris]